MYVRQALTDGATLPAMFYFNRIKHTGCHDIQYNRKGNRICHIRPIG